MKKMKFLKIKEKPSRIPKCDGWLKFFRILSYVEIALICQIALGVGNGVKPLLLLPLATAIAVYANEWQGALAGMICGFFTDMSCGRLLGFNACIMIVLCTLLSFLFARWLQRKFINYFVLNALACGIQGMLDWFFNYVLPGYEDSLLILKNITLKSYIETLIASIIIFWLVYVINKKLKSYEPKTIEEAIQYKESDDD